MNAEAITLAIRTDTGTGKPKGSMAFEAAVFDWLRASDSHQVKRATSE